MRNRLSLFVFFCSVLSLSQASFGQGATGTLDVTARIAYTDAEGDEVQFDLDKVEVNPALPADAFTLKIPEGTRVLRRRPRLRRKEIVMKRMVLGFVLALAALGLATSPTMAEPGSPQAGLVMSMRGFRDTW